MQIAELLREVRTKIIYTFSIWSQTKHSNLIANVENDMALKELWDLFNSNILQQDASSETLQPFRDFLSTRWKYIQNTDLVYPYTTQKLITQICLSLAKVLSPYFQTHPFFLLMPSLEPDAMHFTLVKMREYLFQNPELRLSDFMLSDDNRQLIEIEPCFSMAENRGIFNHTIFKTYRFDFNQNSSLEKGKIIIGVFDKKISYKVLDPSGQRVEGEITSEELNERVEEICWQNEMTSLFPKILEILSKRKNIEEGGFYTNLLSEEEKKRLQHLSKESHDYFEAITARAQICERGESFGSHLQRLIDGLNGGGGKNKGIPGGGEEFNAGSSANIAIVAFNIFINQLTRQEKKWLMSRKANSVIYDGIQRTEINRVMRIQDYWVDLSNWDDLKRRNSYSSQDSVRYCVELIAKSLEEILNKNRESLFNAQPKFVQGSDRHSIAIYDEQVDVMRQHFQNKHHSLTSEYTGEHYRNSAWQFLSEHIIEKLNSHFFIVKKLQSLELNQWLYVFSELISANNRMNFLKIIGEERIRELFNQEHSKALENHADSNDTRKDVLQMRILIKNLPQGDQIDFVKIVGGACLTQCVDDRWLPKPLEAFDPSNRLEVIQYLIDHQSDYIAKKITHENYLYSILCALAPENRYAFLKLFEVSQLQKMIKNNYLQIINSLPRNNRLEMIVHLEEKFTCNYIKHNEWPASILKDFIRKIPEAKRMEMLEFLGIEFVREIKAVARESILDLLPQEQRLSYLKSYGYEQLSEHIKPRSHYCNFSSILGALNADQQNQFLREQSDEQNILRDRLFSLNNIESCLKNLKTEAIKIIFLNKLGKRSLSYAITDLDSLIKILEVLVEAKTKTDLIYLLPDVHLYRIFMGKHWVFSTALSEIDRYQFKPFYRSLLEVATGAYRERQNKKQMNTSSCFFAKNERDKQKIVAANALDHMITSRERNFSHEDVLQHSSNLRALYRRVDRC